MQHDKMLASELSVGMVVHLCPKTLRGKGAKPNGPSEQWVQGNHFFICVAAGPKKCSLLPLFSNSSAERKALSTEGRTGHEKWTHGTFHFYPWQTWTASRDTISQAARAGGDLSRTGSRNLLDPTVVPTLP
ncbi:MAG: hypothetical protein J7598_10745 [Mitsuaria chitosanitabida]|uniref:hypothetical protein n=1 Tax=Roseateles chitosanitabidus TaxID=65048 RepID=UPI001B029DE9|nr:hypothetical protein [Roseateles chitosanitabidus]MBO9687083.1 hypothetical protein [Roseateles chitosanitabidus]